MDRFIDITCSITAIEIKNLKSNMDRFIVSPLWLVRIAEGI